MYVCMYANINIYYVYLSMYVYNYVCNYVYVHICLCMFIYDGKNINFLISIHMLDIMGIVYIAMITL